MPVGIILMNYTDQGVREIKGTTERIAQFEKLWESMGGKALGTYLTMGQYDLVSVGETPNDEALATFVLKIGVAGNARTTTLKGFTVEEAKRVLEKV
jgi:uncharacterized protein with GYD domain